MKNESSVVRLVKVHRFARLLCVLIAEIFASPAADYHPRVGGVLAATMCLILLGASGSAWGIHHFSGGGFNLVKTGNNDIWIAPDTDTGSPASAPAAAPPAKQ